jgi:hypothetical protein
MKTLFFIIFTSLLASPTFASPYVNVEANAGLTGSSYAGTITEFHMGYEGTSGDFSYYGQIGPALVTPDGRGSDVQLSGKIGIGVDATENLNIYGEYWLLTGSQVENLTSNFKVGVKYKF